MALASSFNHQGHIFGAFPNLPEFTLGSTAIGSMAAVGNNQGFCGRVWLSSGIGTSKTISAAGGGSIAVRIGARTWANAATNLRLGIQDVAATGLPDGTFDVQADLVPGVDTMNPNEVMRYTMTSGTKTITHGDNICVLGEMTARGGADSVQFHRGSPTASAPYSILNSTKVTSNAMCSIHFDDGTLGWLDVQGIPYFSEASPLFGNGSTPDEYGLAFRVPYPCGVVGAYLKVASMANTDDFECILYSDPFGTPVAERTITFDADFLVSLGNMANWSQSFSSVYNLIAATDYVLSMRPTTANTLGFQRINFFSGNGTIGRCTMLGQYGGQVTRTNQTGAFSATDTTLIPMFGLWLDQFDDGASSGGGTRSFAGG